MISTDTFASSLSAIRVAALSLGLVPAAGGVPGALPPHSTGPAPAVQVEQRVEVTIKDFTFVTRQVPLQLGTPTVITVQNEDTVRHDFSSSMFEGNLTEIEHGGVVSYGRGLRGVFVEPGQRAVIRFTLERPGRYEFRCAIHPEMKGEIVSMSVGAV